MSDVMRAPRYALAPILLAAASVAQADESATRTIEVAGGMSLDVPSEWKSVKPGSMILEHELSIAAPEGVEAAPARLTMMAAGGSVDANLARWIGQFQGTEGGADRDAAEIDKTEVAGLKATVLDHSGVFLEGRPFGPKTPREGYRLLGAIVETSPRSSYFLKLVGP